MLNDTKWWLLAGKKGLPYRDLFVVFRPVCPGAFCILANQTGGHHTRWKDTKPPASHRRWQFSWRACSVNDSRWSALLAWILQIPSVNLTQQRNIVQYSWWPLMAQLPRDTSYPSVYPQCNGQSICPSVYLCVFRPSLFMYLLHRCRCVMVKRWSGMASRNGNLCFGLDYSRWIDVPPI